MHQSSSYFFIFSMLSLVGTSVKYSFPLISSIYSLCWKQDIKDLHYKFLRIFFWIFDRHISNIVNKNISVWLFIHFNIIFIKTFYVDDIIEKVVCAVFYIYIYDFITHFLFIFSVFYLWNTMVINVFVLLDILSNNSKC